MERKNKKLNKNKIEKITVELNYNEWEEVLLAMILLMSQRKKDKQEGKIEKIYNSIKKQIIKKIIKKEAKDQA